MGIKKQYLKNRPICKVTFQIPEEQSKIARKAQVLGDFNNWSVESVSMKRMKTGAFNLTLELETGQEDEFRYLLDGAVCQNEIDADGTAPTPFGDSVNSKIKL